MPLFFSTNIVFGRGAVGAVEPFTLAFLRWGFSFLILLPFVWGSLRRQRLLISDSWRYLFTMGFLGMWVCGAIVYFALKYTSATNGVLIYTSSPVIIILIEWLYKGRKIGLREALGVGLAFVGVVAIVVKGKPTNLLELNFNVGDLIFVAAAFAWAIYSVGLKSSRHAPLQTLPLFALIAGCGALLLAPFALGEIILMQTFPTSVHAWVSIAGIISIASLLAFSTFQYGIKVLGASVTGIFMYLLPVYGVALAVIFLGEELSAFHFWGILLVVSGVVIATYPASTAKKQVA